MHLKHDMSQAIRHVVMYDVNNLSRVTTESEMARSWM